MKKNRKLKIDLAYRVTYKLGFITLVAAEGVATLASFNTPTEIILREMQQLAESEKPEESMSFDPVVIRKGGFVAVFGLSIYYEA